jgi:serine/threonine-protein kinase
LNAIPVEAEFLVSRSFFKPYRIGVALATAATLLASFTPASHRIESLLPDWTSRFVPEAGPPHSLVLVAVDATSLDAYGPWPWPRDRLAGIVKRLTRFGPKALGVMLPLTETETPHGLGAVRDQLDGLDEPLRSRAAIWVKQLDTDAQLSKALRDAGKVVLAAPYAAGSAPPRPPARQLQPFALTSRTPQLPWYITAWRWLASGRTWSQYDVTLPAPVFSDSASGVGLATTFDDGQHVPGTALVVNADGRFLPAFELALLAAARNLGTGQLSVDPQMAVLTAGKARLGNVGFSYYPRPAAAPPVYSLKDVMTRDSLARGLHGQIVLLGLSAPGLVPVLTGPPDRTYTPLSWSGHLLGSMLEGNAFAMPNWFFAAQRGLLVLFGLYLILLPANWLGGRGMVASGLVAVILLNTGVLTLILRNLWLPVVGPALFLVATQLLLSFAYRRHSVLEAARRAAVEARIALGCNLQSQGQLDLAMERFAQCLPDPAALEPLYELGLEYERRRQVGKARSVYELLQRHTPDFRDCAQRRARLAALSDRFPSASPANAKKTLVLDAPLIELPVLGRYRLERELGRGAMGTVYLARDPTIGRKVAVKTLPIMEAYEGREQAEVAARFFKEAEAVGRLDHPNIVSVHDAGKEHDLAYIAMDYVPGESLDAWTGKSELLPVWEVLEIAAQVADALAYAHDRKVVHRDVKPANIIYDRDSGVAKITDFGVARILDTSRTRSGTVLGTPSYMSPEQVAGKKADGRSDLFSLGTTLYQLLTGSLPFEGDSVATLMYQIANQKPPAIRKVRRGLPVCVARLVTKALQKDLARRFATGESMAAAILNCRAQFKGGRRKTA